MVAMVTEQNPYSCIKSSDSWHVPSNKTERKYLNTFVIYCFWYWNIKEGKQRALKYFYTPKGFFLSSLNWYKLKSVVNFE